MRNGNRKCTFLLAVAGCVAILADSGSAGLAKLTGGSGYSGNLSRNKIIRRQELICDPANPSGAPVSGSTSVAYNPDIVSLSGLLPGPGYSASGFVEEVIPGTESFLQSINSFLVAPKGTQTGYVQVSYTLTGPVKPGILSPLPGFTQEASDGVIGFDTHALLFDYHSAVPDSAVATYTIFASTGRTSGAPADSLTGSGPSGKFTLDPPQLSSATVSGDLSSGVAAVPLPPAAFTGSAMLLAVVSASIVRRSKGAYRQGV